MSYQNPCRHHPNSPFTSSLVMGEKRFAASLSPPASPLPGKGRPCTTQPPLSRAGLSCARPLTGRRAAATAACALPGLKENPLYVSSVGVGTVRQAAWPGQTRSVCPKGGNDWQAYVGANPPCHTAGFRVEQINVVIPRVFTRGSMQGSTPRTWGASLHQDHGENVGVSPRAHPITVPPPNGGIAPV